MRIALVRTALGAALAALLLTLAPVGIASAARDFVSAGDRQAAERLTPKVPPDAVVFPGVGRSTQHDGASAADFGNGINNFYSGRCLDADLGSIGGNGTVVQLWDCAGGSNQLWFLSGTQWGGVYTIRSVYNERCLDADLGSIGGNGTRIQLWDCAGDFAHNQNWYFTGTPWGGVYKIHSFYNNRCLDADLGSIGGNGTRIELWDCGGDFAHNQNWYFS